MKRVDLDASKWANAIAFYDDLLGALEAPHWHGYNINALIDSVVWGDINAVEPPYTVRVHNLYAAAADARDILEAFISYLPEQKMEYIKQNGYGPQVFFEIIT